MHRSSMLKFRSFVETYIDDKVPAQTRSILDIGSASYNGHSSYRQLSEAVGLRYVGLDMQKGNNVDIVSKNPVIYDEIDTEAFDYIVSGQTFEHNPYFWVTFGEMARILKPGGLMFVVAPGGGKVHRFPYDCWRFYPDSWAALCAITGLELIETIFEPTENATIVAGAAWRDSAVIARKKPFVDDADRAAFYDNLEKLCGSFRTRAPAPLLNEPNAGPAFKHYMKSLQPRPTAPKTQTLLYPGL